MFVPLLKKNIAINQGLHFSSSSLIREYFCLKKEIQIYLFLSFVNPAPKLILDIPLS